MAATLASTTLPPEMELAFHSALDLRQAFDSANVLARDLQGIIESLRGRGAAPNTPEQREKWKAELGSIIGDAERSVANGTVNRELFEASKEVESAYCGLIELARSIREFVTHFDPMHENKIGLALASQSLSQFQNRLVPEMRRAIKARLIPALSVKPLLAAAKTEQDKGEVTSADAAKPEERKPDGPFDIDGFRFRGVEVRFGSAAKQITLVTALWDCSAGRPLEAQPIEDVMVKVYGEEHETKDSTFRQLCSDVRKRFEAKNFPLGILNKQGKVQLSPKSE